MTVTKTAKVSDGAVNAEDTRRMKKRELDRRCQRMARDRTKAHIAHLEKLVEEFRSQDSTGRIASLMEQLDAVKKERDELAKTLASIAKLSQPHQQQDTTKSETTDPTDAEPEKRSPQDLDVSSKASSPTVSPKLSPLASLDAPAGFDDVMPLLPDIAAPMVSVPLFEQPLEELDFTPQMPPTMWPGSMSSHSFGSLAHNNLWDQPESLEPQPAMHRQSATGVCECSLPVARWTRDNKPANLWRYANDVLIETTTPESRAQIVRLKKDLDEEIPIRAVLEGWDAVEHASCHNPNWRALRQIDEQLFSNCNMVERLAALYVMNDLLRAHAEPGEERLNRLPAWFQARLSSSSTPYAVNYFTWPGLRRRFEISPHRYCSNDFWELFATSFRIQWPFEFRDCYSVNRNTNAYKLDVQFVNRLRDLRNWTMGPEFFRRFPELYSDVPAGDTIPDQIWQQPTQQMLQKRRRTIEDEDRRAIRMQRASISSNHIYPMGSHPSNNIAYAGEGFIDGGAIYDFGTVIPEDFHVF